MKTYFYLPGGESLAVIRRFASLSRKGK